MTKEDTALQLDLIEILKVIFLGIVEGITEWLPISSTGHMLLVDEFITLQMSDAFKEMFFVVIQLGAILAVVVLFWGKMFPFQFRDKTKPVVEMDKISLWLKVVVACIPGAVVTLLFDDYIEAHLHTPAVIAAALIIYGIAFIVIENWNKRRTPSVATLQDITYRTALLIGLFQVLSIIPLGRHNCRRIADRGIARCGGRIYVLPRGAGHVRLERDQDPEIRFFVYRRRTAGAGDRHGGGVCRIRSGHQVPDGIHQKARL